MRVRNSAKAPRVRGQSAQLPRSFAVLCYLMIVVKYPILACVTLRSKFVSLAMPAVQS